MDQHSERVHAHATNLLRYGQYAEAEVRFREYVGLNEGARDPLLVVALQNIGVCRKKLGDYEQATDWYRRALDLSRAIGYLPSQADLLSNLAILEKNLARAALEAGDVKTATRHFEAAVQLYKQARTVDRETGNLPGVALDLYNLGIVYTHMRQPSTAKGAFDECATLATSLNDRVMLGKAQFGLGRLFESTGKLDAALSMLEQAVDTLSKTRDVPSLAHACTNLGALLFKRDDLPRAYEHLLTAQRLFSILGQSTPESRECDSLVATVTSRLGR
jgi:tetratricopeptide (TPR) repeat protein